MKVVMEVIKGLDNLNVVFIVYYEYIEDWNIIMYLSQLCYVENKVVLMLEFRIIKDVLVDKDGVKIDVLYC